MIETLISLVVPIVFGFIMFALGITTKRADFAAALLRPRALIAGLATQLLLLPLAAFAFVSLWGLSGAFAFGVMILAACPGGVTTNMFTHIAGGRVGLSIAMTAVTTGLAPVTVPLWAFLWSHLFLEDAATGGDILGVSLRMLAVTVLPVLAGGAVAERRPDWASRLGSRLLRAAMIGFWLLILAGIAASWQTIAEHVFDLGLGMLFLALALMAMGAAIALLLRLGRRDAVTFAIECGVQNGTVGLTFLGLLFGASGNEIPAPMVPLGLYGIIILGVVVPFSYAARFVLRHETP